VLLIKHLSYNGFVLLSHLWFPLVRRQKFLNLRELKQIRLNRLEFWETVQRIRINFLEEEQIV